MSQFDFEDMVSRPAREKHLDDPRNVLALDMMAADEVLLSARAQLIHLSRVIVNLPPSYKPPKTAR